LQKRFFPFSLAAAMNKNLYQFRRLLSFCAVAALSLAALDTARASLIFEIGISNNSSSDFEQEGGARNDRNYYWENGDYTSTAGLNGNGANWSGGMEIWNDPRRLPHDDAGDGTIAGSHSYSQHSSADDAQTIDGFPRALTTGFNTNNIFFQLDAAEVAVGQYLRFDLDVAGGRTGTTHDLEFLINNTVFHTVSSRPPTPGLISAVLDPSALGINSGPAVVSLRRTGGVTTSGSAWIVFDSLALSSVPEPSTGLTLLLLAGSTILGSRRRRALVITTPQA